MPNTRRSNRPTSRPAEVIARVMAAAYARDALEEYFARSREQNRGDRQAIEGDAAALEASLSVLKRLSGATGRAWPRLPPTQVPTNALQLHSDALKSAVSMLTEVLHETEQVWSCPESAVEQILVPMLRAAFEAGAVESIGVTTRSGVVDVVRVILGRITGTSSYVQLDGVPFGGSSVAVH